MEVSLGRRVHNDMLGVVEKGTVCYYTLQLFVKSIMDGSCKRCKTIFLKHRGGRVRMNCVRKAICVGTMR